MAKPEYTKNDVQSHQTWLLEHQYDRPAWSSRADVATDEGQGLVNIAGGYSDDVTVVEGPPPSERANPPIRREK